MSHPKLLIGQTVNNPIKIFSINPNVVLFCMSFSGSIYEYPKYRWYE